MNGAEGYYQLVGYLILFVAVGFGFIFVHLVVGKLLRPAKPVAEKLTIYECGEPTIGSAWIQFDLRFYVVALLFVIFDVEVAFFFPWAVVFGKANTLAQPNLTEQQRLSVALELVPPHVTTGGLGSFEDQYKVAPEDAQTLAWIAFGDIVVFFGVLLVGFAYLWRRGDLNWVRSTAAEKTEFPVIEPAAPATAVPPPEVLVGAGH
jgi:NADH-quinone oxidoreductase subunit A